MPARPRIVAFDVIETRWLPECARFSAQRKTDGTCSLTRRSFAAPPRGKNAAARSSRKVVRQGV